MDISLIINLVLSGLMLLILICSVLYGLIIGFKQSLANGIFNLVLVVLLFFLTNLFANSIINFDLSTIGVSINGANSINQAIINTIQNMNGMQEAINNNPEILDIVVKIPLMIATPLLFTIFFWLVKLIVFIISLIVNLFTLIFVKPFTKSKSKNTSKTSSNEKLTQPKRREKKKSKHHGFGALVGLGVGLITILATFIPIFGLGEIATKLNAYRVDSNGNITSNTLSLNAAEENLENTKPLLEYLTGNTQISEIITAYNNSTGINICKVIGIEKLGTVAFNSLSTTNINGNSIKLLDEIDTAVIVYNDFNEFYKFFDKTSLNQDEMTQLISSAKKLVNNVFKSKFINVAGSVVISSAVDMILSETNPKLPDNITSDEIKYNLTKEILNNIKEEDIDKVKEFALDLINIFEIANNNGILAPMYNKIKSNENISTEYVLNLLNSTYATFSEDLSNAITKINIIEKISPTLVNSAFKAIFRELYKQHPCEAFEYNNQTISLEQSKAFISTCLKEVIETLKTIDINSELYVTKNSFIPLGDLLDYIKSSDMITNAQYNEIISFAQEKLNNITSSMPINLSTVINNLSNITDWNNKVSATDFKDEFTKIGDTFEDIKTLIKEINSDNIDITKLDLTNIGKIFDKLEKTKLFNNAIVSIYNSVLDTAKTSITNYESIFDILKINEISVNWEKELGSIEPLISSISEFSALSFTDIKDALKLISFCEKFDLVEQNTNSTIYSTKMQNLLKEILTITKNLTPDNETIANVCNSVINKLDNRVNNESLKSTVLKGIFNYTETLIPDVSNFSDNNIKAMINEIKNNINKIVNNEITANLEDEINYMIDFKDYISDLQNFESLTDERIEEVSNFLDTLSESKIFSNSKTHILNSVIDSAINAVNGNDLKVDELLASLKTKTSSLTITSLIADLKTIKNEASKFNNLSIDTMNTQEISDSLNVIRSTTTFDDNFTNSVMSNLLDKINNDIQNESLISESKKDEINSYVTTQKTNLNNSETEITNTLYKEILDGLKDTLNN